MENSGKQPPHAINASRWWRSLYLCVAVLLSGMLLSGCAACPASEGAAAEPLLLFQKTPCYGSCPAYDATFYTDGRIAYIGYRHAPVQDTLQLCLPKYDLQQLKKAVADLPYTSFADAYRSRRTDQPSTYLTFYQNGRQKKRIRHQEGGPPALLQFQEIVEKLVLARIQESMKQVK